MAAGNCTQFSKGLGMDATGNPFKVYVLFQMGSQDWYLSDTFHLQLHIYDLSVVGKSIMQIDNRWIHANQRTI